MARRAAPSRPAPGDPAARRDGVDGMSGETGAAGTGGQPAPEAARAEIGQLWNDTAFQGQLAAKDPAATERWNGLYAAAYPDEAAGDDAGGGDVRVERT